MSKVIISVTLRISETTKSSFPIRGAVLWIVGAVLNLCLVELLSVAEKLFAFSLEHGYARCDVGLLLCDQLQMLFPLFNILVGRMLLYEGKDFRFLLLQLFCCRCGFFF